MPREADRHEGHLARIMRVIGTLESVRRSGVCPQLVAVVRMGDLDQCLRSLADALAERRGDVPLGDDRPDVGAGCHDAGSGRKGRNDVGAIPPAAVDGRAIMAFPSSAWAAPRMKSIWPPAPLYRRRPIESATTCPVRSTSIAELIATIRPNERMTWVSFVKSTERISNHRVVIDESGRGAEAMGVRWRGVDQDRIKRQRPRVEQPRHIRQEDRHVIRGTLVHNGPGVGPDEQGAVLEVAGHLGRQVWTRPFAMEVDDADITELRRPSDDRVQQHRGRRRGTVEVDLVSRLDAGDRLLGTHDSHGSV